MSAQEIDAINQRLDNIEIKVDLMLRSLKKCQTRCHVDNPPGRWRALGRAILGLARPQPTTENEHE